MSTYFFDNITYTYSGSTASVTTFNDGVVTATILSSFVVSSVTYNVTSIGNSAFDGKSAMTSVTIPNSVTSIGNTAFRNCSALNSVSIGTSVASIGNNTFQSCSALASITLPSSLTTIGSNAFLSCTALASITIPNSVTNILTSAFEQCSNLTSITLPTNASFTTLSTGTFYGCIKLASITIPSSVTTIQSYALSGAGLTSITIPNSVASIGDNTFGNCTALASVTLPTNASFTTLQGLTFDSCTALTSIIIPNSVTTINQQVFIYCNNLTSVTIGSSVTTLSFEVFRNCSKLASITFPNSVTTIGDSICIFCPLLTSATLPTNASFTSIGNTLFSGCTALPSITIPSSVTSIGNSAFINCTSLTSIIIPSAVTSIGTSAFQNCSLLTKAYFLRTPLLATPGANAFSVNPPTSVGKYYATVTNSSVIAPFFTSLATITTPTLTSMTPFNSNSAFAVVVISYANLVTNSNASVDSGLTYVFLVNSVSSGSLSIGATQGSATPWNASTNKTIAAGTNAYWTPSSPSVLWDAFSVVIQDSLGAVSSPNVLVQVAGPYPCFLEGTKILCFENNEEVYRSIESLQKGDLVKTIYNGYMPVNMMGTTKLYNPGNDYRTLNRIYKCPKENYPTLFEDLYITGCHSILVPSMTDDQWENTKAINKNIYVTDNHFRLIACADEKAEPYNEEGFMNIYHIALDHHDICMNYGIYANGLLVESCSIEFLIKYSNLKIMGQDETAVSQDVDNVSNNMTRQLVDIY